MTGRESLRTVHKNELENIEDLAGFAEWTEAVESPFGELQCLRPPYRMEHTAAGYGRPPVPLAVIPRRGCQKRSE